MIRTIERDYMKLPLERKIRICRPEGNELSQLGRAKTPLVHLADDGFSVHARVDLEEDRLHGRLPGTSGHKILVRNTAINGAEVAIASGL